VQKYIFRFSSEFLIKFLKNFKLFQFRFSIFMRTVFSDKLPARAKAQNISTFAVDGRSISICEKFVFRSAFRQDALRLSPRFLAINRTSQATNPNPQLTKQNAKILFLSAKYYIITAKEQLFYGLGKETP